MKVLFLLRGDDHPASRYRAYLYFERLRAAGIVCVDRFFPSTPLGWALIMVAARKCDVVFIQKKRVSSFWLAFLRNIGPKIVYDIDDAVMFNSSRHPNPDSPTRMRRFISMVKSSDLVIAGNDYLSGIVTTHNPNCVVIPTSLDMRRYPLKDHSADPGRKLTIGWIGGGKSVVFLDMVMPALEQLSAEFDFEFKVVCNMFPKSNKVKIVEKYWTEAGEGADVASFNIGLSPLPDDPWAKGKCATKLLQCMAAGIPTVSSNAGMHPDIIEDGKNGFLASSTDEWVRKLRILLSDRALRKGIGLAGRKTVDDRYSLDASAPKLEKALRSLSPG